MLRASTLSKFQLRARVPPPTKHIWRTPGPTFRTYATQPDLKHATLITRKAVARAALLTLTAAASSLVLAGTVYADHDDASGSWKPSAPPPTSLGALVRAYAVYSMCSVPALVDASPSILAALSAVPGVRQVAEAFVRVTFFDQFVGADSAEEAIPLLYTFRAANRGVLFAYSVEVDEGEATGASFPSSSSAGRVDSPTPSSASSSVARQHTGSGPGSDSKAKDAHKRIVDEMLHCIDVAADFEAGVYDKDNDKGEGKGEAELASSKRGKRTWVAVKMTALLPDAHALIALSSHITSSRSRSALTPESTVPFPGAPRIEDLDVLSSSSSLSAPSASQLTAAQIHDIKDLYADLRRICARAREGGVKVIVDAEYSWYQPAIDALTLALMREFNALALVPDGPPAPVQPLVYGTFQAYLRRTPQQLALALADARTHNYALGAKLVRGAYHPHELAAHRDSKTSVAAGPSDTRDNSNRPSLSISPDVDPPVWTEKRDTDAVYDACVRVLVGAVREDVNLARGSRRKVEERGQKKDESKGVSLWSLKAWASGLVGADGKNVNTGEQPDAQAPVRGGRDATPPPRIGVLFGTHNWDSCALILKELVRTGLAVEVGESGSKSSGGEDDSRRIRVGKEVVERVAIGQLYGMSDDLTEWVVNRIVSSTPFVIKYVPYGALADVMPYLSRRAIENKSVLGDGNAQHERDRARNEIRKRLFG